VERNCKGEKDRYLEYLSFPYIACFYVYIRGEKEGVYSGGIYRGINKCFKGEILLYNMGLYTPYDSLRGVKKHCRVFEYTSLIR
jgi:hypothetical protein